MRKTVFPIVFFTLLAACSQEEANESARIEKTSGLDGAASELKDPTTSPETEFDDEDDEQGEKASLELQFPTRFHGRFAESLSECDYPSHGLFTVKAKSIEFFESVGEVRNVRADGAYAAATVYEQYGDGLGNTYAFYMRLMPDGSLRYRYDQNDRITWVRCP